MSSHNERLTELRDQFYKGQSSLADEVELAELVDGQDDTLGLMFAFFEHEKSVTHPKPMRKARKRIRIIVGMLAAACVLALSLSLLNLEEHEPKQSTFTLLNQISQAPGTSFQEWEQDIKVNLLDSRALIRIAAAQRLKTSNNLDLNWVADAFEAESDPLVKLALLDVISLKDRDTSTAMAHTMAETQSDPRWVALTQAYF